MSRHFARFSLLTVVFAGFNGAALAQTPAHKTPPPGMFVKLTNEADRFDHSHKGTPAPTGAFTGLDGKPVSLAKFRGHPVLVNFWATWCVPCIKELPQFDALAGRSKGKMTVIAISEDSDVAKVAPFWAKQGFKSLATYTDAKSGTFKPLTEGGLPLTILYDSKGKEVWRASGGTYWVGPLAAKMIAEAR